MLKVKVFIINYKPNAKVFIINYELLTSEKKKGICHFINVYYYQLILIVNLICVCMRVTSPWLGFFSNFEMVSEPS